MSHTSSPRTKAPAFVIVAALLCALFLAMAPAAFAEGPNPVKVLPHQMSDGAADPAAVTDYGTFDNPNYYYASVKVAPTSVWYRQTSFSPDGMKLVAQKSWTDTASRTEIVLMDADGSNETVISPGDSGTGDIYGYMNPFWSDDGTAVGFAEVHNANPNKIVRYLLAGNTRSYIYEPVAPLDANNPDFLGNSTTSIVFWAYGVGGSVADLFTWDGSTLTNLTNTADYKEYEPVSNADGSVILYWSGETTAEPDNTTHTLTNVSGTWTKDVAFTPIPNSYWGFWTGKADNYIGLTVMSSRDVHIYNSSGAFVMDLTGPGYSGGTDQWNFFGNEGASGEFVMTTNANRGVVAGRDIVVAAPRSEVWVDDGGSDANPGTQAAPFATIQKGVDTVAVGGTVNVAAGTYAEHVAVNKAVSLVGAAGATIDGGGTGTVVAISAGGATVEGFTIQHSGATAGDAGVSVTSVSGCTVKSNTVTNNANGIALVMASGNFVTSNVVNANAFYGIALTGASSNMVDLNTVTGNGLDAIALDNASAVGGDVTTGSTGNFIKGNTISSNRDGIFLGENCDNNQVTDGNTLTNIVSIGVSAWRSDGHTITGNAIHGAATGVRLLGSSNNTITANALTTNDVGIKVDASWRVGVWYQSLNNTISGNDLSGNTTYGVQTGAEQTTEVTAENNWWGSACGPAAGYVSANVDYTPWWADAAGTFSLSGTETTITAGMTAAQQSAIINCAAPGATITYAAGSYPGGVVVTADNVTINLSGATIGAGSPAFEIVGDDVTFVGPGTLDGTGGTPASAGVLVQAGADNFTLQDVEVKNWADGVQVAGAVTSLKIVNNYIHNNDDAGLQVDGAVGGVQTVEGNLFKANGPAAITSVAALKAQWNSFATKTCPAYANVDTTNCTFAETYIDVDPITEDDQYVLAVNESTSFDVKVMVEARNLYGYSFKLAYDGTKLRKNTVTPTPPSGYACLALTVAANEVGFQCVATNNPPTPWDGGAVLTINFTATGAGLTGDGSWTALFDVDHVATTAGTANGAKVYLNNVYGAASEEPNRNITDANDGEITITGIAQYTGFIDVQGRADDSGAVLDVFAANTLTGSVLATATSAKSGAYTTAGTELLTIGTTYYVFVDKPLYLRTRVEAAYVPGKQLTTRPLTTLSQLVLKGGDADDNEEIDINDAGCIGGAYGSAPGLCGSAGSTDVNGDGKVDILDLTLMGGNYGLTYSAWTP